MIFVESVLAFILVERRQLNDNVTQGSNPGERRILRLERRHVLRDCDDANRQVLTRKRSKRKNESRQLRRIICVVILRPQDRPYILDGNSQNVFGWFGSRGTWGRGQSEGLLLSNGFEFLKNVAVKITVATSEHRRRPESNVGNVYTIVWQFADTE